MTTLRILHITPYAGDAWAYGGIPRIVSALAREQARRGHAITILATDAGTEHERATAESQNRGASAPRWPAGLKTGGSADSKTGGSANLGTHLFRNPSNQLAYSWQAFWPIGMSRFLADHAGEFDVAHLHACRNFPGVIAARHLRGAGVPYVLVPNGTAPIIERRFLAKRVFDFAFGNRVMAGAAAVVAVSDAEREQLLSLGVPLSKNRMAANPVDLDEFVAPPSRGQFRARFGLGDAPVVLFLGKLTPRKRVDVLIDAFAQLARPDARLVVAGNDMGSGRELRALAQSVGLGDRVVFTGLLAGSDRLAALADADVVVYPSANEIFGLVPLESILAGTPVVVADDSGCGEIIRSTGGGLVVPLGNAEALHHAIARVLDDRDAWRPRVRDAAAGVRRRFSPAVVADTFDEIYDTVLPRQCETAASTAGVSVVVPVRNGATWIAATLEAIWREQDSRPFEVPFEVIVVDDGSDDGSVEVVRRAAGERPLRIIAGEGRGAAAALNVGFRAARFPIVCQIDQDVTISPGWLSKVTGALDDPRVAAAQGRYVIDPQADLSARIMALDLEQRYAAIAGTKTSHVCTGNAAYRADAVHAVGLFDETIGYGYDNDLSYRLRAAGHRLAFVRDATSVHHWRDRFTTYLRQQYGFGYGRLDLVAKHPARVTGDSVSPVTMMAHPIALAVALMSFVAAAVTAMTGASSSPARALAITGAAIVAALFVERLVAGVAAWRRFGDRAALLFPIWHLARDFAWVAAIGIWTTRRLTFGHSQPAHSMSPRPGDAILRRSRRASARRSWGGPHGRGGGRPPARRPAAPACQRPPPERWASSPRTTKARTSTR
jgi:glycosyltransferase involved in cell wall biosynthesis/GT2 family glycosyltransferase